MNLNVFEREADDDVHITRSRNAGIFGMPTGEMSVSDTSFKRIELTSTSMNKVIGQTREEDKEDSIVYDAEEKNQVNVSEIEGVNIRHSQSYSNQFQSPLATGNQAVPISNELTPPKLEILKPCNYD